MFQTQQEPGKTMIEEILSSTEMLVIIFVLLGLVFAAAAATRIWYVLGIIGLG